MNACPEHAEYDLINWILWSFFRLIIVLNVYMGVWVFVSLDVGNQ